MREILFRGKRVDNGDWAEGSFVYPCNIVWMEKGFDKVLQREDMITFDEPVYSETVGQYTGITDKNGEKIFEGDVLAEYEGEDQWFCYGIVEYDSERGQFYLADGRGHYASYAADEEIYGEEWNNIEIVGNIHDSPELLAVIE